MTQRVGSNRIANNAITLDKIASGVLDSASDLYARNQANAAFETANAAFETANNATDTYARAHANAAFETANNVTDTYARNHANAAFISSNTKFSSTGGTIVGDVIVSGNLTISGETVTHSANNLSIDDSIILLANNNPGNLLDIGFVGHYEDDGTKHTGLVRDVSSNTWYLFEKYEPHVQDEGNLLNIADPTLVISTLRANISTPHLSITGNTESTGYFAEKANIIASGLDANNTYLLTDGVVHYHTGVSSANANVSLTGFAEVGVGNAVSMAVIITNNVYKRYISTVEIDGTSSGVTTIWSGESAPTEGSANTDIYSFSVIKTAATPTYTVFASLNSFG